MCKHKWAVNTNDGKPDFRINRQMSTEPVVRATCSECGCRTWLTKTQWKSSNGDG